MSIGNLTSEGLSKAAKIINSDAINNLLGQGGKPDWSGYDLTALKSDQASSLNSDIETNIITPCSAALDEFLKKRDKLETALAGKTLGAAGDYLDAMQALMEGYINAYTVLKDIAQDIYDTMSKNDESNEALITEAGQEIAALAKNIFIE